MRLYLFLIIFFFGFISMPTAFSQHHVGFEAGGAAIGGGGYGFLPKVGGKLEFRITRRWSILGGVDHYFRSPVGIDEFGADADDGGYYPYYYYYYDYPDGYSSEERASMWHLPTAMKFYISGYYKDNKVAFYCLGGPSLIMAHHEYIVYDTQGNMDQNYGFDYRALDVVLNFGIGIEVDLKLGAFYVEHKAVVWYPAVASLAFGYRLPISSAK